MYCKHANLYNDVSSNWTCALSFMFLVGFGAIVGPVFLVWCCRLMVAAIRWLSYSLPPRMSAHASVVSGLLLCVRAHIQCTCYVGSCETVRARGSAMDSDSFISGGARARFGDGFGPFSFPVAQR